MNYLWLKNNLVTQNDWDHERNAEIRSSKKGEFKIKTFLNKSIELFSKFNIKPKAQNYKYKSLIIIKPS